MTSNPIGVVICRIAAIWLAVTALTGVGYAVTTLLTSKELDGFFVMSLLSILAPLASAFILWHYAESISSIRYQGIDLTTSGSLDSRELVMIGTHLLGIYILVLGVINAAGTETVAWIRFSMYDGNGSLVETMSAHTIGGRVSYALQIALGFALLIRGKKGLQ